MTARTRMLTGITTSGTPHLGNYVGAIRPAIAASRDAAVESFYFLADYHALVKCQDPRRVHESTLEIAATWLALGLDPDKVFFYRQSDIPGIPELTWLLSCVAAKGLLNRAHAYKAAVDANVAAGDDGDAAISMGLFSYPVLMAADILMFNAERVPVGRDQVQHIEMARDFAQRFNHVFGAHYPGSGLPFVLPEAVIDESVAVLPGLDGRKMSKSYDNTIPLWLEAAELRRALFGILTDSRRPGERKDTESSSVYALYSAFASAEEAANMRQAFADGIAWGDAKQALFERVDAELSPARERYRHLMERPSYIEEILKAGGARASARAQPFMEQLRWAVGVRPLAGTQPSPARAAHPATAASEMDAEIANTQRVRDSRTNPSNAARTDRTSKSRNSRSRDPLFKQWREKDGTFHFRLIDEAGEMLMQGHPVATASEAGQCIAALRRAAIMVDAPDGDVVVENRSVGRLGEGRTIDELRTSLVRLAES